MVPGTSWDGQNTVVGVVTFGVRAGGNKSAVPSVLALLSIEIVYRDNQRHLAETTMLGGPPSDTVQRMRSDPDVEFQLYCRGLGNVNLEILRKTKGSTFTHAFTSFKKNKAVSRSSVGTILCFRLIDRFPAGQAGELTVLY